MAVSQTYNDDLGKSGQNEYQKYHGRHDDPHQYVTLKHMFYFWQPVMGQPPIF